VADIQLYKKFFKLGSVQEVAQEFRKTLVTTNRSYLFYVDWLKVKKNVENIKTELSLLDSLINSKNLEQDFFELLSKYPEVTKILPILLAIRELSFDVIESFDEKIADTISYSFNRKKSEKLSEKEIESYWSLIEKSGAIELFTTIKNFKDYIFGVEVGMDTNARKNRSGKAMELILAPLMDQTRHDLSLQLFAQKKFGKVEKETEISFPDLLKNKKFDFLFVSGHKALNVEVNYFDGGGSKQEIINSYIERQNKLQSIDGEFVLITDGQAWNRNINNELDSGLNALHYVLNLSFVRKGFFQEILTKYFGYKK
jgi:type II restriction enzyme